MAMTIHLSDAGKRFNREWIFRHLTYSFEQGNSYAITGANGSGKSTLLQVIAGAIHFNEGTMTFSEGSSPLAAEKIYRQISLCAPYVELVEEMTLKEFLDFHQHFKPFLSGFGIEEIISILGLQHAAQKEIRNFSSGMKQRVKLAQCIFSDTPVVLLDEPCTNLDIPGIELYQQLIRDYCKNRLVIVSSNDVQEYGFCNYKLEMNQFKK
jgi:ABC-type multidrug transport system ATPase subunit